MSEPMSFISVGDLYLHGKVSFVEYKKILKATFRLMCKVERNQSSVDHILIKFNPYGTSCIPYLKVRTKLSLKRLNWISQCLNTYSNKYIHLLLYFPRKCFPK